MAASGDFLKHLAAIGCNVPLHPFDAEDAREHEELDAKRLHRTGTCQSMPTYFCPHCASEALHGVDLADPSGWRGR